MFGKRKQIIEWSKDWLKSYKDDRNLLLKPSVVNDCLFLLLLLPLSLEKNHSLQRNLSNLSSISDENSNLDKDSASEDGSDRCSPILYRKSPSVVDSLSSVDLSESEVAVHKNTVEVGIKKFHEFILTSAVVFACNYVSSSCIYKTLRNGLTLSVITSFGGRGVNCSRKVIPYDSRCVFPSAETFNNTHLCHAYHKFVGCLLRRS